MSPIIPKLLARSRVISCLIIIVVGERKKTSDKVPVRACISQSRKRVASRQRRSRERKRKRALRVSLVVSLFLYSTLPGRCTTMGAHCRYVRRALSGITAHDNATTILVRLPATWDTSRRIFHSQCKNREINRPGVLRVLFTFRTDGRAWNGELNLTSLYARKKEKYS